MIAEKEREALMRLSLCARRMCAICKYKDNEWDQCLVIQAGCVSVLFDAVDKVEENKAEADGERR